MSIKTWEQFLIERTQHEFSSSQIQLPLSIATRVRRMCLSLIPDKDLFEPGEYGREDDFHITLLYGLHDNKPDNLRESLKGESPFEVTLGKVSIFENDRYDVVKISIKSKGLHQLHNRLKKLCKNTQTFDSYIPHCTLAYVKKGLGEQYAGDDTLEGVKFTVKDVVFSNKNRIKTKISLHE